MGEVDDTALIIERGGDTAKTADESVLAESRDDAFDMSHAVQHRHDHPVRPDGGSNIFQGSVKRISLHREQDRVVWRVYRVSCDKFRYERDVAMRADDMQPLRLQLVRASFRTRKVTSRPA